MLSSPADNKLKDDAHRAQSRQRIEPDGLVVGRFKFHTVPMAAHASNGFWTPVGLRRVGF